MPGALASPNAQGPSSIGSPVPAGAALAAPPPSVSLPPMPTPQANAEPTRAPSSDFGDFASLVPNTSKPANAFGDFGALVPTKPTTDASEPDATAGGLGDTQPELGGPHLVRLPDGSYGMSQPGSKQITEVTPAMKTAAKYMAHALRIGGPGAGAVLAEAIPGAAFTGPVAPAAGSVAGGEAVHPVVATLEAIAGEAPSSRTNADRALEAVGGGAGKYVGKLAEALVHPAGAGFGAETGALAKAGEQTLTQEAGARAGAMQEAGVPAAKVEAAPEPATGPESARVGRDQQIANQFNELRNSVGPKVSESEAKSFSTKTTLQDTKTQLGNAVGKMLKNLEPHVRQRRFDVGQLLGDADAISGKYKAGTPSSLTSEIADLRAKVSPDVNPEGFGTQTKFEPATPKKTTLPPYDEMGRTTPNVPGKAAVSTPKRAQGMQPVEAGAGSRGLTFDELEALRKTAQANANFGASNRTPQDKAWGEFYSAVKAQRNVVVDNMANETKNPRLASDLKIANKAYSESIDKIDNFVGKFSEDPSMVGAARIISQKSNPKELGDFLEMMPDEKRAQFQRLMSDEIIGNPTRENFDAKGMESRLNAHDLKNQDLIFGEQLSELKKLINAGKVADASNEALKGKAWHKIVKHLALSHNAPIRRAAMLLLDNPELVTKTSAGSKIGAAAGAAAGGTIGDLQGR